MSRLTVRQEQVLYDIADGLTNAQIAEHIGIEVFAVKDLVKALMQTMGATNRAHIVALAYHEGLLKAPGDARDTQ